MGLELGHQAASGSTLRFVGGWGDAGVNIFKLSVRMVFPLVKTLPFYLFMTRLSMFDLLYICFMLF